MKSKTLLKPLGELISYFSDHNNKSVPKFMTLGGNIITTILNLSQISHQSNPLLKKAANLSHRCNIFMSGFLKTIHGLTENNLVATVMADMPIAFTPIDRMYQLRGFSMGLHHLSKALHKHQRTPKKSTTT